MKKILSYVVIALMSVNFFASCADLDTNPTDQVAGATMMDNTDGGMMALNGTIRSLWQWGWTTTGNYHQCVGPMGYSLAADLMCDDLVMAGTGNGWFWHDYILDVKDAYTNGTWRPYDLWNYFYTLISNVNYILDAEETMQGNSDDVKYVMGNAYAIRAYAYAYAGMWFARSYIGHEDKLCVPIYLGPTDPSTKGQPRSTNREVFAQAMSDINKACELLNGQSQKHISQIDMYVANGIKARIALYMGDYQVALDAAKIAMSGSKKLTANVTSGYNSATLEDVMWGAELIKDQGTTNPQFMAHMDPAFGGYGDASRKCVSPWLYNHLGQNDSRRAWWKLISLSAAKSAQDLATGYQQYKFKFADPSNPEETDHIFMRVPEMYLTAAECCARLNDETNALKYLNTFMSYRDPDYDCKKTGLAMGALTTDETGSLLEEIILQRRIELWGEFGRMYDVKRLRQGIKRTTANGFQTKALLTTLHVDDPESFDFVMTIPQVELDANKYMVQNPVGSYATDTEGDDPSLTPVIDEDEE